jgi:tetratricopeptide (TPR) repeat protein
VELRHAAAPNRLLVPARHSAQLVDDIESALRARWRRFAKGGCARISKQLLNAERVRSRRVHGMRAMTRSIKSGSAECRAAAVRAVAALLLTAAFSTGAAQELQNNDYYSINQTERGAELLKSVEKYHMKPAEDEIRQKRYQAAWGDIDFMLRAFPNHPQVLLLMIDLCAKWKSPRCTDDLAGRFERAIAVNPRAPNTFVVLGIYQQRNRAYREAISSYERALALDPESVNAHYNLGLAYLDAKNYELANQHAQQAYRLGAQLPGLRAKLTKAGRWDPSAAPPAAPQTADSPKDAPRGDSAGGAAEPPK